MSPRYPKLLLPSLEYCLGLPSIASFRAFSSSSVATCLREAFSLWAKEVATPVAIPRRERIIIMEMRAKPLCRGERPFAPTVCCLLFFPIIFPVYCLFFLDSFIVQSRRLIRLRRTAATTVLLSSRGGKCNV